MDIDRQVEAAKQIHLGGVHPHNVNGRAPLSMGRSVFPEDAVARIYQPCRSVLTSRRARTEGWRLVFERRTAPFIEPLMGYMGGTDTLAQIELNFPTLEAAVCYAERQGLAYNVRMPPAQASERCSPRPEGAMRAFSDTGLLEQLGPAYLQESYGYALAAAANRNEPAGHTSWNAPMDVVQDRTLSLEAKRSALMSWAWTEHLIDKATNEGMPENGRSSRLDEVERAVFALERQDIGRVSAASMGKAARGGRYAGFRSSELVELQARAPSSRTASSSSRHYAPLAGDGGVLLLLCNAGAATLHLGRLQRPALYRGGHSRYWRFPAQGVNRPLIADFSQAC